MWYTGGMEQGQKVGGAGKIGLVILGLLVVAVIGLVCVFVGKKAEEAKELECKPKVVHGMEVKGYCEGE